MKNRSTYITLDCEKLQSRITKSLIQNFIRETFSQSFRRFLVRYVTTYLHINKMMDVLKFDKSEMGLLDRLLFLLETRYGDELVGFRWKNMCFTTPQKSSKDEPRYTVELTPSKYTLTLSLKKNIYTYI